MILAALSVPKGRPTKFKNISQGCVFDTQRNWLLFGGGLDKREREEETEIWAVRLNSIHLPFHNNLL